MDFEDAEKIIEKAKTQPKKAIVIFVVFAIIAIVIAYATSFFAEKAKQHANSSKATQKELPVQDKSKLPPPDPILYPEKKYLNKIIGYLDNVESNIGNEQLSPIVFKELVKKEIKIEEQQKMFAEQEKSLSKQQKIIRDLRSEVESLYLIMQEKQEPTPFKHTITWDPVREPDLDGYKLYWGTRSGNYTYAVDVGNTTQYTLTDLDYGVTYYIALTAYNVDSYESDFSPEIVINWKESGCRWHVVSSN